MNKSFALEKDTSKQRKGLLQRCEVAPAPLYRQSILQSIVRPAISLNTGKYGSISLLRKIYLRNLDTPEIQLIHMRDSRYFVLIRKRVILIHGTSFIGQFDNECAKASKPLPPLWCSYNQTLSHIFFQCVIASEVVVLMYFRSGLVR